MRYQHEETGYVTETDKQLSYPWFEIGNDGQRTKKVGWYISKSQFINTLRVDPCIADVYGAGNELLQNAALISAAPELYEACKQARDMLLCHTPIPVFDFTPERAKEIVDYLQSAITKAEGRE